MTALAFFFNRKEIFQHTHCQRLAKAARPRNQSDFPGAIDELANKRRFIDKIELLIADFPKVIYSYRHFAIHFYHLFSCKKPVIIHTQAVFLRSSGLR